VRLRPTISGRNKYGAIKTKVDGITFDSKKEANRYVELRFLEVAGKIKDLEIQPKYDLIVNGVKIGYYKADFRYIDLQTCNEVVEDVKSKATRTPVYRIKKKILETYDPPVVIREI